MASNLAATGTPASVPAATDAFGFQGLNQLSAAAKADPRDPRAIRAVAQQFEAMFMQQMLAAMDKTSFGPDLLGQTSGPMYKSMMNQQLASTISEGRGIGLADFLARELSARYGAHHAPSAGPAGAVSATGAADSANWREDAAVRHAEAAPGHAAESTAVPWPRAGSGPIAAARRNAPMPAAAAAAAAPAAALAAAPGVPARAPAAPWASVDPAAPQATSSSSAADGKGAGLPQRAREFVQAILPSVRQAAAALDVNPVAILAQAALETGWGRHAPANNLFGVKAGSGWQGPSLSSMTQEVEHGVASTTRAAFRAYDSAAASVRNYADVLLGSPRYASVRGHGNDVAGFAGALQRSGYATDPGYAAKLVAVATSPTMREALAAAGSSFGRP